MAIQVRAKTRGYYGQRRRPGAIFEIDSEEDMGKWMEDLSPAVDSGVPINRACEIRDAIELVDHDDESHWTQQGLVRLEFFEGIVESITREEINAVCPGFNRST